MGGHSTLWRPRILGALVLALGAAIAPPVAAQAPATPPPSPSPASTTPPGPNLAKADTDLDALMARVLARRNETWKALSDYVLDERERFGLTGPADLRLFGSDRSYTWYVRDGVMVRSPVKADGVAVPEPERRAFEDRWLAQERSRAARDANKAADEGGTATPEADANGTAPTPSTKALEPRFVSEAYFLRFRFEKGRYLLAGRETIDGRPVLKVEYYPTNLFRDQEHKDRSDKGDAKEQALARDVERKMNKTALVTLWIDTADQQIVRYVFENLGYDFLPAQWLVRVGDTTASMTMGRYFDGVWLPKSISMHADVQLAIGSFDAEYERAFLEYRKAETSARIRAFGDVR